MDSSSNENSKQLRETLAANVALRKPLEEKLLSHGGSKVTFMDPEPNRALILERGELFPQRVRLQRGKPNNCHGNAAMLWANDINNNQLVTGYGLAEDGEWVSHSWVLRGKTIIETTFRFERYFGVVLPRTKAVAFLFNNVSDLADDVQLLKRYAHLLPLFAELVLENIPLLPPQQRPNDEMMALLREPFPEIGKAIAEQNSAACDTKEMSGADKGPTGKYSTDERAVGQRIRRLARRNQLIAKRRKGLWCFTNFSNLLESPESGLDDEEALRYLLGD